MRCKHAWEVVDKTILSSPYEQLRESDQDLKSVEGNSQLMFQKKLILVLRCVLCGALDKTVEVNPE